MDTIERNIIGYTAIKEIIDTTEKRKLEKYKESVDNNWMADYTDFVTRVEFEAYKQIKDLTKD